MRNFFRIIRFGLQNFWRNIWLSLITISMLVLTLLTINILLVLNQVTDTAISAVEQKVDISVYFEPDTPEETIRNAAGYLRGLEQVRNVEVITASEALERFKERHANDEAILASLNEVDSNPFGDSLIIKAYSAEDFDFIIEALDNPQFKDVIRDKDFSNYSMMIDRIVATTDNIRMFGIFLSAVFLLISILIIINTVRIAIFVHREEIGIMKLVGATNSFVKGPFLFEALFYSFLSTAIAAGVMFPVISFLEPRFNSYLVDTNTDLLEYFIQNAHIIFGAQFLGLALVSIISTAFAMRKYLRV